jgi:hypothetical protein
MRRNRIEGSDASALGLLLGLSVCLPLTCAGAQQGIQGCWPGRGQGRDELSLDDSSAIASCLGLCSPQSVVWAPTASS